MRLSDHIATMCGSQEDIGGLFSKTSAAIREAERFELSDDVARAAYNLTRLKPTSLLNTMPLCRSPYHKIWLEWRGGITSDMIKPENKRDPLIAPDPLKQGCLIETDESGQRGTMTFCWVHKARPGREFSGVNVAPLGALFNWDEDGNVFDDAVNIMRQRYPTKKELGTPVGLVDVMLTMKYTRGLTDQTAKEWMERSAFHDWSRHSNSIAERRALQKLNEHAIPFIVPHALGFVGWCASMVMDNEVKFNIFMKTIVQESWEADIEGEPPFADTVIAMMNSRNAIEHRPVDLSALNKSRAKRGRPTFLPYSTTHLRLSQAQTRAFRAGLLSREDAGRHSVRGHFKIRTTGVYWWSPFFRGDPNRPLHRREYEVH